MRAQAPQTESCHRGCAHTVGIKVAMDQDGFAVGYRPVDSLDCDRHIRKKVGVVQLLESGPQKVPGPSRVAETADSQDGGKRSWNIDAGR
jgi:hypothetical protein